MLYSTGHTNEVVNQTPFGKEQVCISILLISFKFDLKLNAETICHLFSRCHHSHNLRVENVSFIQLECFLWYWVDCLSLNTNNFSFRKLNNHFWRCVLPQHPRGTCRKSSLDILSELFTQWNAGCTTLNNVHYDCTYPLPSQNEVF